MPRFNKENDTDFKWYVVHINQPGKELVLRDILEKVLGKVKNITDYYCPVYAYTKLHKEYNDGSVAIRRKVKIRDEIGKRKEKREKVLPLFAGMVYVRATQTALTSFLSEYFPIGTVMYTKSVSSRPSPVVIKDETMRKLRDFNDNLAAEPVLLQRPFNDYAFNKNLNEPNDTIMVVDGILAGRTGYLIRINGNRGLALQVEDPAGNGYVTVGIPNIRSFHIVRVRNTKIDSSSFATRRLRAIDLLVGMIQGAGIPDYRIISTLYEIIMQLKEDSSFNKLTDHFKKDNLNGKPIKSPLKEQRAILASSIERMSTDNRRLVLYLVFVEEQAPGYIEENYQNLAFRPFLTPSSGIQNSEEEPYGVIIHKGFIEVIKPVEITESYYNPQSINTEEKTDTYYAHIGIKYQDGAFVIFANWNGLLSKYFMTEGKASKKILCGTRHITYKRDKEGNLERDSETKEPKVKDEKLMDSFLNYAKPLYDVLSGQSKVKAMPNFDMSSTPLSKSKKAGSINNNARSFANKKGVSILYIQLPKSENTKDPMSSDIVKRAIDDLISEGVKICTSLSRETHIKVWRDLLNTVWLHK